MIPCANPLAGYLAHKDEIDAAVAGVLGSGAYILGENVSAFEREFAAWCGADHAVGVGSGTEALHLALRAVDVGPGDEVVVPSHTAVATIAAIELCGAAPVFADIDPETLCVAPEAIERAVTSRTKALIPVHLYGHPADMEAIMALAGRLGLPVVEDCAQAHGALSNGAKVGTIGRIGCFSFYPTKNLGALGDGGAVICNDPETARRMRELREYGWRERFISERSGWNSRLDEIQAAILRVRLRGLDADNAARRSLAAFYDAALADAPVRLPAERPGCRHAYHLYVIRSSRRDELLRHLRARGVGAGLHYPMAVHQQPAYAGLGAVLPETERAMKEILSLPFYPELSGEDARAVAAATAEFFRG